MLKRYVCTKCEKELDYHPRKLMIMGYKEERKEYRHVITYCLCKRCYTIFKRWLFDGKAD